MQRQSMYTPFFGLANSLGLTPTAQSINLPVACRVFKPKTSRPATLRLQEAVCRIQEWPQISRSGDLVEEPQAFLLLRAGLLE